MRKVYHVLSTASPRDLLTFSIFLSIVSSAYRKGVLVDQRSSSGFRKFSDEELDIALVYVRKAHGDHRVPDRDLLRTMADKAAQKWAADRRTKLPMLVADVIREFVRERTAQEQLRYEAYQSGVMKLFSERSRHKSQAAAARRKKEAVRTRPRCRHPFDAHGQYRLI